MRYDCWKDYEIDKALDEMEKNGETLPQYRFTTEWNGTEWVTKSVKVG